MSVEPKKITPKESTELTNKQFDKLIEKLKEDGAEVTISDEAIEFEEVQPKKPLDLSLIPNRIKISELLKDDIEGFNVIINGSVLNVFLDAEADKLTTLDIDIDLSDKFAVLYLFRFKSIEFNIQQEKGIRKITVDSEIINLNNLNLDSIETFEQRLPFNTTNEVLDMLNNFKNLKKSKFYVQNLDFEQMYEFYEKKPKETYLFHPDAENPINHLSNQYKQDKNIHNLLHKLSQLIIFGE
jgi:hypothetical protein